MKRASLILIAAPSGAGKNSFLVRALGDFSQLEDIVTYTTRQAREGEEEGKHYHFVSPEKFRILAEKGFFLEWSRVHDASYGTSKKSLEKAWERKKTAILDIDVQGVDKITRVYRSAISVFILPPSLEELKRRILGRERTPPENLELRMANAEKEMKEAYKYDYQIVNDDFEKSYGQFKKILEDLLSVPYL